VEPGLNGNLSLAGNIYSPEDPNGHATEKIVSTFAFCYRQVKLRYSCLLIIMPSSSGLNSPKEELFTRLHCLEFQKT